MKGVIIYKGKYGATRQYSQWLGWELNLPVVEADNMLGQKLKDFTYLLIGTSVYIGKLQISQWLRINRAALLDKKIFFFQVAGTPANQIDKLNSYYQSGVPEEIRKNSEVFFLEGKLIMQDLSRWDRFMLKMGARLTGDPGAKKAMLTDYNHVTRERIIPLVKSVQQYISVAQPVKNYT
ncbi:MAG TPA: flavodoxin domain-containing protein [Chitinophagaceae bacterium]